MNDWHKNNLQNLSFILQIIKFIYYIYYLVVLVVKMPMSIKISEENYRRLNTLSGKLREKFHKPVSINEAISFLYERKKISDLAGTWKMSDEEIKAFMGDLKKGWSKWKIKSA